MRLWRALLNHPKLNLETIGPLLDCAKEPESSDALQALAEIFGLTRFDAKTGSGLPDLEMLDVAGRFNEYMDVVKKNIAPGPTPPPPGDLGSWISLEPQDGPESASGDSSSIPAEPTSAAAMG